MLPMKKGKFIFYCLLLISFQANAQKILPGITVKNIGGKIIVSWQNQFTKQISNIFIQRSYDSLKNYTTIGTVLNPLNRENGYSDINPPFTKMYYRVSVTFEGGEYFVSNADRPVKEISDDTINGIKSAADEIRYPWEMAPADDSITLMIPAPSPVQAKTITTRTPQNPGAIITPPVIKNEITYPSQRIYTTRDNNIAIVLKDAPSKRYTAKFFDENNKLLFELTKLTDEYLIVEKVNFLRSGWFRFEIYDNGVIVEKNKFFISKDLKEVHK